MLPTMGMGPIEQGDTLRHVMAGGGGWGDPLERDPELVRIDVADEKLTVGYAREVYGVVVDAETLTVDEAATAQLRSGEPLTPRPPLPRAGEGEPIGGPSVGAG